MYTEMAMSRILTATRHRLTLSALAGILGIVLGLGVACQPKPDNRSSRETKAAASGATGTYDGATSATPAPRTSAEFRETARAAGKSLQAALIKELSAAMGRGGPVEAITVCNTQALAITGHVNETLPPGSRLKRIGTRLRNPANAPTELEAELLRLFTGENAPESEFREVQVDGQRFHSYSQPIRTQPQCLVCHGDPAAIAEPLRAELARLYPADKATGYQDGELRGILHVLMPVPQAAKD